MDKCTGSRAAEVSNVSTGLDLRTLEAMNHTSTCQDLSREGANGKVAEVKSTHDEAPHEIAAHNEVGDEEPVHDEADSDEIVNGSEPSEPEVVVPSAEPRRGKKRKRPLSHSGQVSSDPESSSQKGPRGTSEPIDVILAETDEEQKEIAMRQKVPEKLRKYFGQRYRLFHLYDEGIQLDEEAWYSVTPEKIAAHIASRFSHLKVVVDLYSCVGGNSIQFAKAGIRVIAVEIDQKKIDMAKNNATIYRVKDGIEFRKGDVSQTLSSLKDKFDSDWGIFLSPPWGGPGYVHQEFYDVSCFKSIVETAKSISANVAILVPRNSSNESVIETFGRCEVEENYLGGKLKTKTLYFGDLEGRGVAVDDVHQF